MKSFIRKAFSKPNGSSGDSYIDAIRPYTMCDLDALRSISRLASYVTEKQITGDLVECGVCNGGTAALIASLANGNARKLWLYDSFEGMPETKEIDGEDAKQWVGKCVGQVEIVYQALNTVNFPNDRVILKKGWFDETFKQPLPDRISFLNIDADWYASVSLCLETFYDRVVDGGVILLDDFGYWEGCREAYYDFCGARKLKPLLERAGRTQAYWIKGRGHNRDSVFSN
jgi:O-methyltransferase